MNEVLIEAANKNIQLVYIRAIRIFFCRDSEYALDSAILLRDRKSIIDRAFLTASSGVYLYITKTDNKYGECLIDIMHLRQIFSSNISLIIYFALEVF